MKEKEAKLKAEIKDTYSTVRVTDKTRVLLMLLKQQLGLKTIDEAVLMLYNTHQIQNTKNKK